MFIKGVRGQRYSRRLSSFISSFSAFLQRGETTQYYRGKSRLYSFYPSVD
eukprot:UN27965